MISVLPSMFNTLNVIFQLKWQICTLSNHRNEQILIILPHRNTQNLKIKLGSQHDQDPLLHHMFTLPSIIEHVSNIHAKHLF